MIESKQDATQLIMLLGGEESASHLMIATDDMLKTNWTWLPRKIQLLLANLAHVAGAEPIPANWSRIDGEVQKKLIYGVNYQLGKAFELVEV